MLRNDSFMQVSVLVFFAIVGCLLIDPVLGIPIAIYLSIIAVIITIAVIRIFRLFLH